MVRPPLRPSFLALLLCALGALAGCERQTAAVDNPPVRVAARAVAAVEDAPLMRLTGEIRARVESDLAFRVGGRIIERSADVGDHVRAGTVLARVDPREQEASVTAAEAAVAAAEARLRQVSATFERQRTLLSDGFTTRRDFDQAQEAVRTARGALESARAEADSARDQRDQTVLRAAVDGIITARSAEVGQVVQAAEPVFTLAHDGPRDAVFNVQESLFVAEPASPAVALRLVAEPSVTIEGTVREVSPVVDPATGTVRVKVGIDRPPPRMTLRAAVIGEARMAARQRMVLPWSALTSEDGEPAVWRVDPASRQVALAPVAVHRYDTGQVVLADGLQPGDLVVTAGGQLLHPGQTVEIADAPAPERSP